jgi:hypothetical protein
MYPSKQSRFREARHVQVQAGDGDLDQVENDMRSLGAYRMSANSRTLVEPDLTPRKLYGDFPAIPNTPKDYTRRFEKPNKKNRKTPSSPRQNRVIGAGQGQKSERPLTRVEKEQEYAAIKIQSISRGRAQRAKDAADRRHRIQQENRRSMLTSMSEQDEEDGERNERSQQSLRERRRSKSRERVNKSPLPAVNLKSSTASGAISQPQINKSDYNGSSNNEMVPSPPGKAKKRTTSPRKNRTRESSRNSRKGSASPSSVNSDQNRNIDFDAVEQLRLKLKVECTTHKGLEPSKLFDKWDKDKDGELDRDEVLEGMNKLLGKDVLEEWNMFENFFSYIDTDGDGSIDRNEFAEFVSYKPDVQVLRRRSEAYESPKQVFENFHGTFQGDKHKGGQKGFGSGSSQVKGDAWDYRKTTSYEYED